MPPDDKLGEDEKAKLQESLKEAALDEIDIQGMAQGLEESEPVTMPVDSSDDLLSAAAIALEFVEGLETPEAKESPLESDDAVAGFDALLRKLENLRSDISSLQRGVVGVFAAQLLTFRGKVVELKSRISEEMVERLRMKFFKSFIESTFVDIVDNEFAALEKDLVDRIVEQTQERFKEFAQRVRESELDLRTTIIEQQDIVRSFMQSLEEDGMSLQEGLVDKNAEITKLEHEVKLLQAQIDKTKTTDASTEELKRKLVEYDAKVESLREDLVKKDLQLQDRVKEVEVIRSEKDEISLKLAEAQSEVEVYKAEAATAKTMSSTTDAEYKALESKVSLLEKAVEEKREEAERVSGRVKFLERSLESLEKEKETAEKESQARLEELESMANRINEVKELEQRIYDLETDLKSAKDQIPQLEMQKDAFEKATRLMEKERDMALEAKEVADERTRRYIQVMNQESSTKVMVLVDEVGNVTLADLAKSLGQPVGLVTKWVRQLDKLGVVKLKGDRAISTLKELDIQEGEVKID
ncbi:MAG: hypothetical protein ACFE7R_07905 [Candidatus Hodarchaeota archaeon]